MAISRGRVSFKLDNCKGCGNCAVICPKKIIFLDTEHMNSWGYFPAAIKDEDMDKCIACSSCGLMCPDGIITVEKLDEEKK